MTLIPAFTRAPAGGHIGLDGQFRRGGEFEPFYVPRQNMPQVDAEDMLALLSHLARNRVPTKVMVASPDNLLFHQHVFEQFIPSFDNDKQMNKPLLISKDGYVLDGNHRAAAHKRYGTRPAVIVIPRDFTESMKLLFSFPGTYTYGEGHHV